MAPMMVTSQDQSPSEFLDWSPRLARVLALVVAQAPAARPMRLRTVRMTNFRSPASSACATLSGSPW